MEILLDVLLDFLHIYVDMHFFQKQDILNILFCNMGFFFLIQWDVVNMFPC